MKMILKSVVTIIYFSCVCYIVFFARRRELMQYAPPSQLVNLVPVVHQIEAYKGLNPTDPREAQHFVTNLLGNVALFVPFSILLLAFGYRSTKGILLTAFLVSLSIEVIQYSFAIGVADVDDVLLNVGGAYAGILLFHFIPVTVRSAVFR